MPSCGAGGKICRPGTMTCLPAPGSHGSIPGLTRISSSDPKLNFLARSYSVSSYTVSTVWSSPNTVAVGLDRVYTVASARYGLVNDRRTIDAAAMALWQPHRVNFLRVTMHF